MASLPTIIGFGLALGIVALVVSSLWPKPWVRLFAAEVLAGIGIGLVLALA